MAEAYRCDRCGELYDGHDNPITINDKDGYTMNAKQIQIYGNINHKFESKLASVFDKYLTGPSETEKLDLCENCMRELELWLNHENTTVVNK